MHYSDLPSNGSTHHVGCLSIKYSWDWPLAYVPPPRNLLFHTISVIKGEIDKGETDL